MCTLLMFISHVNYKRTRKMNATELSSELWSASCCLETYEYLFYKLTRPHCIKKLPSDHSGCFFLYANIKRRVQHRVYTFAFFLSLLCCRFLIRTNLSGMHKHQQQGYQINESLDTAKEQGRREASSRISEQTLSAICLSLQSAPPEILENEIRNLPART